MTNNNWAMLYNSFWHILKVKIHLNVSIDKQTVDIIGRKSSYTMETRHGLYIIVRGKQEFQFVTTQGAWVRDDWRISLS